MQNIKQMMVQKTIAFATHEGIQENFEYGLQDTPCFHVSHNSICIYTTKVCDSYPADQLSIDMNINGYIGTPLHDSKGAVAGLVVGLFEQPIEDPEMVSDILKFFEGHIPAELERSYMV